MSLSDVVPVVPEATLVLQGPNLQCFIDRAGAHPDRLQQMYFNTVLLLRAVSRLGPYLSEYDYCSTGTHEEDGLTKNLLGDITNIAHQVGKFDEKLMFARGGADVSGGRPFRLSYHSHDYTGLETGVQGSLQKHYENHGLCRLRQMQVMGEGSDHGSCNRDESSLRTRREGARVGFPRLPVCIPKLIGFSPHSNRNLLTRSEVVALINTLHRFAESLHAVNLFRGMWAAEHEPHSLNDASYCRSLRDGPVSDRF